MTGLNPFSLNDYEVLYLYMLRTYIDVPVSS